MPFLVDFRAFRARRKHMGKSIVLKKFEKNLRENGQVLSLLELRKPDDGKYGKVISSIWPESPAQVKKRYKYYVTDPSELKAIGLPGHVSIPCRRKKKKVSRDKETKGIDTTSITSPPHDRNPEPIIIELSQQTSELALNDKEEASTGWNCARRCWIKCVARRSKLSKAEFKRLYIYRGSNAKQNFFS
ncbi:hypothetical protein TWF281_011618 [Arthrobotrys megalospora]